MLPEAAPSAATQIAGAQAIEIALDAARAVPSWLGTGTAVTHRLIAGLDERRLMARLERSPLVGAAA